MSSSGAAHCAPLRRPLKGAWAFALVASGAGKPEPGDRWLEIDGPMTAAAALRERGQWSLDGPALDFDAHDAWWRCRFDAPGFGPGAVMGFDGLATCARAWLNGQPIVDSSSMFIAHAPVVGAALRAQGNELLIECRSLGNELAQRRPRPRWRTNMVAHPQLRWWRTTLLGRTPGWSPPAAPLGPWRDVWLDGDGQTALQRDTLDAFLEDDGSGVVECECLAPFHAGEVEAATLVLEHGAQRLSQPLRPAGAAGRWAARLQVREPQLWWPHTHGEPALYAATIEWRLRDGATRLMRLGQVGFRSVEVHTRGGAFDIIVNGVPVFCRGACWTPLDVASLRASPAQYADAVAQARNAGMNMLRVPGTGVYEEDAFYEACDAQGVLVWQDFMFASMDYPGDDPAFAAQALTEARQQIARLKHHACLAVLCGNSEVDQQAAMAGASRELWAPALFHRDLAQLCAQDAPRVFYWPSSACGGDFPHQVQAGTTSYYGVGAYRQPLHDARRSGLRFATECLAFANVPAASTLQRLPGGLATRAHHPAWKQRSPRDLGAGWDFDDVRDHYVQTLFGVDALALRQSDHARYLALGRLATAEAMASAFGEWRRAGSGCGGALVLCLRDLWAGAGWGLVDDAGVPKSGWHALRRALAPVAAWITDEGLNGLACHVANDGAAAQHLTLEVAAWRDGDVQVAAARREVLAPARSVQAINCHALFDTLLDLGWRWRFGPPTCQAVVATLKDPSGELVAQAFHFPLGLGLAQEADVGLQAQIETHDDETAVLQVSARRLALGVSLEAPGWLSDDDFFHLAPGQPRRLRLRRHGAARTALRGTLHAVNALGDGAFAAPAASTQERLA